MADHQMPASSNRRPPHNTIAKPLTMFKLMPKFVPKTVSRRRHGPPASGPPHGALSGQGRQEATAAVTTPADSKTAAAATRAEPIIADRGEFIDALARLRCGHVLVRPRAATDDEHTHCLLDNGIVYTSFAPLLRYGLISEYRNTQGYAHMRYFRITDSGQRFADRVRQAWHQRSLLERLAVRLVG